jgi:hypothetical protein
VGKRKALSKKNRFDVFKRDIFICQYCGNTPPSVVLEVDHITPVSAGGLNDIDNLITACFDCNRGKGANELSSAPEAVQAKALLLSERQEQLKAFNRLQRLDINRLKKEVSKIENLYSSFFEGYGFSDKFKISVKTFLKRLTFTEVEESMEEACSKIDDSNQALKYFCGICWNKIKDRSDA